MEKLRAAYRYLKAKYELLNVRKYTTVAGMLVFFLIMSIVPLSFWVSLIVGRLPIDTQEILSLPIFDSIKNVLLYVQKEAVEATTGASIILIFTTLYSATNLFYQMRRSGEILYDYRRKRQGLRLRLGALVLLIIVMAAVVVFLLIFALGSLLFSRLLSKTWALLADYALLAVVAFMLAFLLNVYICPYKVKLQEFLPGTWVTVAAWIVAVLGFSVYLKISNVGRLYGAVSAIIVFLLWLYIMMICFIIGVIFNSERILKKRMQVKRKRERANKRMQEQA